MKEFWYRFKYWFCETFGQRETLKTYEGHGNFSTERGWWVFGKWISYDN